MGKNRIYNLGNKSKRRLYCKNCGTDLSKSDTICTECGAEVKTKMSGEQKAELAGDILEVVLDIVEAIID